MILHATIKIGSTTVEKTLRGRQGTAFPFNRSKNPKSGKVEKHWENPKVTISGTFLALHDGTEWTKRTVENKQKSQI